jgi:UDP-N-acetylglucosamine 2-epimerase (non-hydrolysing)
MQTVSGGRLRAMGIVGARPNLMKIAPVFAALSATERFDTTLVHTGQHYDNDMSRVFFQELNIPTPDVDLGVGSGSHAEQTARAMLGLEPLMSAGRPDVVIVVGDVNSTLAGAITAVKLGIPVAHVEAGLRSGDRSMPEEINRMVTDSISDVLLAPSRDAVTNLVAEGHPDSRIRFVGNVMIDTLDRLRPRFMASDALQRLDVQERAYVVCTFHRPSNVDDDRALSTTIAVLETSAARWPVVFPVHPRTRARLRDMGVDNQLERAGVHLTDPLGYLDFMRLVAGAKVVITDSGGIQEETTVLGVPCFTARTTTERPITITEGTNHLIVMDPTVVDAALADLAPARPHRPELWDGHAGERVATALLEMIPAQSAD